MLYSEGATSVTPTLLRLISPFGESDGRYVHTTDCYFRLLYCIGLTAKSSFVYIFIIRASWVVIVVH